MDKRCNEVVPHPQFFESLFAFKNKVSNVFKDIIGIHALHHFAIARIDEDNKLMILSATPALEFTLFNSQLWRFDETYDPQWFQRCAQSAWQPLYHATRYDELYYLKQIKHDLPLGLSFARQVENDHYIYSFATHNDDAHSQELFANQTEDFNKIGYYCHDLLSPLFGFAIT